MYSYTREALLAEIFEIHLAERLLISNSSIRDQIQSRRAQINDALAYVLVRHDV